MNITNNSCSGLSANCAGYYSCKHKHHTTVHCFTGKGVPVCLMDDKNFNENLKAVGVGKWIGQ